METDYSKCVTVDCTPTWEGLLPALLNLVQNGKLTTDKGLGIEFKRMAQAADKWNAHCKETKQK